MKENYQDNKEKKIEYQKQYNKENIIKYTEYQKAYREKLKAKKNEDHKRIKSTYRESRFDGPFSLSSR